MNSKKFSILDFIWVSREPGSLVPSAILNAAGRPRVSVQSCRYMSNLAQAKRNRLEA